MLRFDDPAAFINGATPSVRKAWDALGIQTVGDLLETLPRRYDDFSKTVPIRDTQAGDVITVRGKVVSCKKMPTFRQRFQVIRVVIQDETGRLSASFFNQTWLIDELIVDREILMSGKVTSHPRYGKTLMHPLWEPGDAPAVAAGKLAPVYPLSGSLAQKTYRRILQKGLQNLEPITETLEANVLERWSLLGRREALFAVHEPQDAEQAERGRLRFAFDELLSYHLALHSARLQANHAGAPAVAFDEPFAKRFASGLPFPLTGDQKRSVWAALKDMQLETPMRRLLQGDVGSGKTVVAAFLAAHTVRQRASVAILAPTEILARQHAASFRRLLAPHLVPVLLVTRTERRWMMGQEEKTLSTAEFEQAITQGQIVMIGTHALLQAGRVPADVALVVVDEQHRFGVDQRDALIVDTRRDGRVPHFLSMTATPIPRSLALMMYGDLAVSVLHEKPVGRLPIQTEVCVGERRERAYEAIRQAVRRGEKAFVVCPLIDASDVLGVRAATDEWQRLSQGPLAGLKVGLLHGRLKPAEKERVMSEFAQGDGQVLVATAVIEVGVDVPQATVMAIEGAERFGLAQLHQLRGRVGRSTLPSRCFLLTDTQGESFDRLQLVARTQDGMALAEADLKKRGSGNLMGTAQAGQATFQAARWDDVRSMMAARQTAEELLTQDETLKMFPYWQGRVKKLRETAHLE